jgi:hypothetical protein
MIRRERQQAHVSNSAFPLSSSLAQTLAREMGYTPPAANRFADALGQRLSAVSEGFERARAARERDAATLAPYRRIEQSLAAEFAALTPHGVKPERAVERAAQVMTQLVAVRHLISLFPAHGEAQGPADQAEAVRVAREEMIEKLRAWRDRLRAERQRLRDEINALSPEEARRLLAPPSYNGRPALWQDLAAVMSALEAADGNLSGVR